MTSTSPWWPASSARTTRPRRRISRSGCTASETPAPLSPAYARYGGCDREDLAFELTCPPALTEGRARQGNGQQSLFTDSYQSSVLYHCNAPVLGETIKLQLEGSSDTFDRYIAPEDPIRQTKGAGLTVPFWKNRTGATCCS